MSKKLFLIKDAKNDAYSDDTKLEHTKRLCFYKLKIAKCMSWKKGVQSTLNAAYSIILVSQSKQYLYQGRWYALV